MDEKSFWQFAKVSIINETDIILLTVAESSNSSPGRQGFKMLLCTDGKTKGTIGGGIMEKDLIDYGLDLLNGKEEKPIKRLQHSPKTELEHSGLICGGFQTILFTKLSQNNLTDIDAIIGNINARKNGLLSLSYNNFQYDKENFSEDDFEFNYNNDEKYSYKENIGFVDTAYIIGGGHVGLAVSQIMKFIGFYVVVFDHRKDIFTLEQNIYADEKIITEYDEVKNYIKESAKSYAIIVTPQHSGDEAALGSVINMNLKYIGMMGSKRKIKTVFNNLANKGIEKSLFEKVHSPIGLEIQAETPEEIAVSIASEIIKIKHSE